MKKSCLFATKKNINLIECKMKLVLLSSVIFLSGCSSIGVCNLSLSEEGWKRVESPPSQLVDEYNENNFWFSNAEGGYLACSEVIRRNYCGNVYQIYRKKDSGDFEHALIVCLE